VDDDSGQVQPFLEGKVGEKILRGMRVKKTRFEDSGKCRKDKARGQSGLCHHELQELEKAEREIRPIWHTARQGKKRQAVEESGSRELLRQGPGDAKKDPVTATRQKNLSVSNRLWEKAYLPSYTKEHGSKSMGNGGRNRT